MDIRRRLGYSVCLSDLPSDFFKEYIPKENNSRPAEENSETLLDRFEALVIENGNLKTEITRLQKLLDNAGIKY